MSLASARNTPFLGNRDIVKPQPIEAATTLYVGGMVCLDSNGYLVPGQVFGSSPVDNLITLGIFGGPKDFPGFDGINMAGALIPGTVQAAGAAAAFLCSVWTGIALMDIYSADITQANVGALCYVYDDHTVSSSSNTNARPVAGKIVGFPGGTAASTVSEGTGVWVDFRVQVVPS